MTTEEKVDWREIGEINVQNSLLLVSKLFKINGWDEQSNSEAVELLRPLFIHLDRHKNESITQAIAEERERMRDKIALIRGYHLMRSSSTKEDVLNELFDLLSALPLPDKE